MLIDTIVQINSSSRLSGIEPRHLKLLESFIEILSRRLFRLLCTIS
jgi:hypothetical protein